MGIWQMPLKTRRKTLSTMPVRDWRLSTDLHCRAAVAQPRCYRRSSVYPCSSITILRFYSLQLSSRHHQLISTAEPPSDDHSATAAEESCCFLSLSHIYMVLLNKTYMFLNTCM